MLILGRCLACAMLLEKVHVPKGCDSFLGELNATCTQYTHTHSPSLPFVGLRVCVCFVYSTMSRAHGPHAACSRYSCIHALLNVLYFAARVYILFLMVRARVVLWVECRKAFISAPTCRVRDDDATTTCPLSTACVLCLYNIV